MAPSEPTPIAMPQVVPDSIPRDQLSAYRGCWVAFSGDGCRLIASANTLTNLEEKLRKAGEDLEEVLLDWISNGDSILSGSELS